MDKKEKDQAANDILDAVIKCKYEAGGGSIQITQAAAKAGISTRTLNRYFPDKENLLYLAAVKFLTEKFAEIAYNFNYIDKEGCNGRQKLLLLLDSLRDYYKTDTTNALMFVHANIVCITTSISKQINNPAMGAEVREIVRACIEQGKADGSIRPELDTANTCMLISANYNGLMQRLTYVFRSGIPEEQKQQIFAVFNEYTKMLDGYLKP